MGLESFKSAWERWNNWGHWKRSPIYCFRIENYKERDRVLEEDGLDLMTLLESELPAAGALIYRMDTTQGLVCVELKNPSLTISDVLDIFAHAGCVAHVEKEDKGERT